MILTLVRHGETDYNKNSLIQGHIDNPLNDEGIRQAHLLGEKLKKLNKTYDYLGSSSLVRATKTAEIIGSYINLNTSFLNDKFIERKFGPFDGKPVSDGMKKILIPNYKEEGFEDDEKLIKRVIDGVNELYNEYKGKNVLVVCHSHVIKSVLIYKDSNKYNYNYFLPNLSTLTFKVDKDEIKLLEEISIE